MVVEARHNGSNRTAAHIELVNGENSHDGAAESQRSLFSWAEFLDGEPAKRGNGKPKSSSQSLFE